MVLSNFKGKKAAPFVSGGSRKKSSTKTAVGTLKKKEAALEKGKTKTVAEKKLEAQISKRTGKRYVGKR